MGEFSQEERELIDTISRHHQADINLPEVAEIVNSPAFSPYEIEQKLLLNPEVRKQMTPEIWAAMGVRTIRDAENQEEEADREKARNLIQTKYVATTGVVASYGLQLIKDVDEFWRVEPTIKQIFSLSDSELERAGEYVKEFSGSTHENAIQPNKKGLIERYQQWNPSDLSAENINRGREMYEECVKIYERGFPNLLAMKRIMDGEKPNMEVLHEKSASSVRRELSGDAPDSNSVYFDMIVNGFDSKLRNGIAHNDIVTDPAKSSVRIPTEGVDYSFERFNEIVKENFATGVFLTGTFVSLLEWHAMTSNIEGREDRPEWVFGEQSVMEEPPANIVDMENIKQSRL